MTLFTNQMWQYRHLREEKIDPRRRKNIEINVAKTHAIVYCNLNMYEGRRED